ncbi:MAG: hypothetical protein RIR18_396 [Pseudomonadota bacterium]|jgi:Flp pilus assembly protein TadD
MLSSVSLLAKRVLITLLLGGMVTSQLGVAAESTVTETPQSAGRMMVQAVYQVLLGEIALRRGDGDVAFAAWRDLAVKSEEPYALRRAIEIAVNGQRFDLALPLAARWQALEPEVAEAHYTYGLTAERAGKPVEALVAAQKARQLRPAWAQPWILEAQLRASDKDIQGAIKLMQEYVRGHAGTDKTEPGNLETRQYLARLLVNSGQFSEARTLFRALSQEWPDSPDLRYPVAILSLQMNDMAAAKPELETLLDMPLADTTAAHYFLGQIAEQEHDPQAAIGHFEAVRRGEYWFNARLRVIRLLKSEREESKALTELEKLLSKLPDQPELLYEAALLAEKVGRLDQMEKNLRHLLKLEPDNALALNALGYSLADHRTKLPEAQSLVSKALSLQPEDPFIMDSMGWVLYRQGNLEQAHSQLLIAYNKKADPEIAAHLGEVLWEMNRQDDAHTIWRDALAKSPDNEVLRNTIQRFSPQGLVAPSP